MNAGLKAAFLPIAENALNYADVTEVRITILYCKMINISRICVFLILREGYAQPEKRKNHPVSW